MNSKDVKKKLKQDGFIFQGQKGSHAKFTKGDKTVIVPIHGKKDIPKGTLSSIFKQAGWK